MVFRVDLIGCVPDPGNSCSRKQHPAKSKKRANFHFLQIPMHPLHHARAKKIRLPLANTGTPR